MKQPEAEPDSGIPKAVDTQLIESLAELVIRFGLSEIEYANGDLKVRIARMASPANIQPAAIQPQHKVVNAVPSPSARQPDGPGTVKSPMVGTAYLRSSPDVPPFVEIGTQVKTGDKLLLVEAMKTFNEILAHRAGVVTSILVDDGQPVEYGQPLLIIE